MTDNTNKTGSTHTAYLHIRTGIRKGKVYGYWKDGGRYKLKEDGTPVAFIDMLPRGGWDGRIEFVKFGDPPPGSEPKAPHRPSVDSDHDSDHGDENPED